MSILFPESINHLAARAVLSGIRLLVVEELGKAIVSGTEKRTHERPDPVYPVVAREMATGHGWTEGAGGIQ